MSALLINLAVTILLSQGAAGLALWAAKLRREARDSSLAKLVGAASRVAGRMNDAFGHLPIGLERDALKAAAIAEGVKAIRDEFAPHVRRVSGTDDKLAGIIAGEFGKLPAPVAPAVAAN
ncbi:hypothetical protein BKE38_12620 [Pseudoroseomonas deserti]|uniref:Uncharacterized protein n=1 Tax=Teichococcus deserti TaxID=1817963 RepID=A0A1V2H4G3_9PROT|nr:hypothetical protein [Pseudoroseomonas deserti]ONG53299.1 hypothetical protein BKE38_12620 [Pseudoroseomonas deserti]